MNDEIKSLELTEHELDELIMALESWRDYLQDRIEDYHDEGLDSNGGTICAHKDGVNRSNAILNKILKLNLPNHRMKKNE